MLGNKGTILGFAITGEDKQKKIITNNEWSCERVRLEGATGERDASEWGIETDRQNETVVGRMIDPWRWRSKVYTAVCSWTAETISATLWSLLILLSINALYFSCVNLELNPVWWRYCLAPTGHIQLTLLWISLTSLLPFPHVFLSARCREKWLEAHLN